MPYPKFTTLGAIEAALGLATSTAHRSQLRAKARRLARDLGQAPPPWAAASPSPALPSELASWLEAHPGARFTRLRGGVAIDFGRGRVRHFPSLASAVAHVTPDRIPVDRAP